MAQHVRHAWRLILVLGVLALGVVMAPRRTALADGAGAISGTLTRGGTVQSGWVVCAVAFDSNGTPVIPAFARTDGAGAYTLQDVPAQNWQVWAIDGRMSGAIAKNLSVDVAANETVTVNFSLAAQRRCRGSISPATADIPVWGCSQGEIQQLALTDAQGAFDVAISPAAGAVLIVAHHVGHMNSIHTMTAETADVELGTIQLSSGGGGVHGTITYPSSTNESEPAEKVTLEVFRMVSGVRFLFGVATTTANGTYALPHLPDGPYTVSSTEGYYSEEPWPDDGSDIPFDPSIQILGFKDVAVTVSAGQSATQDFALTWSGGLAVELLEGTTPLADAMVVLERSGYRPMHLITMADEEGDPTNEFLSPMPLIPGTWTLRVVRAGVADYTESISVSAGGRPEVQINVAD